MSSRHRLIACVLALPASSLDASTVDHAREDIRAVYAFDPTTMSFDEQARLAPTLSELWARSSRHPEAYAAALRIELEARSNREMVYCDGGMLLLSLSRDEQDLDLGMASIRKCSLAEIQHTPYFYTLHSLATRGVDTFELQLAILAKPTYSVHIVPHALTLGQDYAFLYPFLVQDESRYVERLVSRLATEQNPTARASIVRSLWYAATPEAEIAVRAVAEQEASDAPAAQLAGKLVRELDEIRRVSDDHADLARLRAAVGVTTATTESELRSKRRARMKAISDGALIELDVYTMLIYFARGRS